MNRKHARLTKAHKQRRQQERPTPQAIRAAIDFYSPNAIEATIHRQNVEDLLIKSEDQCGSPPAPAPSLSNPVQDNAIVVTPHESALAQAFATLDKHRQILQNRFDKVGQSAHGAGPLDTWPRKSLIDK